MLAEQIAESIKNAGVEETASIMARALCYIAHSANNDFEFDCDLGQVVIERKTIQTND